MTTVTRQQESLSPEPQAQNRVNSGNVESFFAETGIVAASVYLLTHDNDPVSKGIAALAAARQVTDAALAISDRELNDDTFVVVTNEHLNSLRLTVLGLGLSAVGNKVSETNPTIGRAMKVGGLALGVAGLVRSVPAIKDHWQALKTGLMQPMSQERKQKLRLDEYNR
ncbi:MAG: hypothetical protein WDN66_02710 [Candidatus Saccharibacteria bacterium]